MKSQATKSIRFTRFRHETGEDLVSSVGRKNVKDLRFLAECGYTAAYSEAIGWVAMDRLV